MALDIIQGDLLFVSILISLDLLVLTLVSKLYKMLVHNSVSSSIVLLGVYV